MFTKESYLKGVASNLTENNVLLKSRLKEVNRLFEFSNLFFDIVISKGINEFSMIIYGSDKELNQIGFEFDSDVMNYLNLLEEFILFHYKEYEEDSFFEFYDVYYKDLHEKENELIFNWFIGNWNSLFENIKTSSNFFFLIDGEDKSYDLQNRVYIANEFKYDKTGGSK